MDINDLLSLSHTVNLDYEEGVMYDITDHLLDLEELEGISYTCEYEDQKYKINIKLANEDFNITTIRKTFNNLVYAIEYSNIFYVREDREGGEVKYTLLSTMKGIRDGFLCEVYFQLK